MRRVLLILFFLSGACAIIYQVVWARSLNLVFGVTSFAVATVLTAFMAGLALGSYLGGRLVDRSRSVLHLFAWIEIGIGVFAALFPLVLSGVTLLYVMIYRQWPTSFYLFSLLRFLLVFSVLLVPTTLMGATLPILAKSLVKRLDRLGSDVGVLYSVNNWGAVLGALAAGFVLIQTLGLRESAWLAAGINVGIGLVALHLNRHAGASSGPASLSTTELEHTEAAAAEPPAPWAEHPRYSRAVLQVVLWVFAIEGFTSLAYEVVWTRMLASSRVIVTTYAFSLVVATFIAGLALGSFIVSRWLDRRKDLLAVVAAIEILIGAAAVLLLPMFNRSSTWAVRLLGGSTSWGSSVILTACWLALLMLIPATLMGMTFPVVSRIYTTSLAQFGRRIGLLGSLDTVGSIFGAFAGGFILIPLLGMQKSVLMVAALNLVLGLAVLLVHPVLTRKRKAVFAAAVVLFGAGAWTVLPRRASFVPAYFSRPGETEVVFYAEDTEGTVSVCQYLDGRRALAVDGEDVAGIERVLMTNQITQACLPLLLYESLHGRQPERVLQIGLGSGHSSRVMSEQPSVQSIHCVELNPEVLTAAQRHFSELNHGLFDNPRYRLIFQDARTYVLATQERYDLITNDAFHPVIAGCANLYSRDFFRLCKERLTEGGIMSVWMPLWHLSPDDLRMIFRSFQDIFPHATLWYVANDANRHAVLIGLPEELKIDFARFRDRLREPAMQSNLAPMGLDDPYRLLSYLMFDERALHEFSRRAPLHSDDHPYLEYSAPRVAWKPTQITVNEAVFAMAEHRASVIPYVGNLGSEADAELNAQRLRTEYEVTGHLIDGFLHYALSDTAVACRAAEQAYALNPDNPNCRLLVACCRYGAALERAQAGHLEEALQQLRETIQFAPDFIHSYVVAATIYQKQGNPEEAISVLEAGLKQTPDYLTGRLFLAQLCYQAGRYEEAKRELRAVLTLIPNYAPAVHNLKALDDTAAKTD